MLYDVESHASVLRHGHHQPSLTAVDRTKQKGNAKCLTTLLSKVAYSNANNFCVVILHQPLMIESTRCSLRLSFVYIYLYNTKHHP